MARDDKLSNGEEASTAMVLAVLLHGVALCAGGVGVALVADRDTYEQPSFLIGNDPPGRLVSLGIVFVLAQIAFAIFSAMDVCNYQLRSMAVRCLPAPPAVTPDPHALRLTPPPPPCRSRAWASPSAASPQSSGADS